MLSTHLRLGLPSDLFPSCYPIKALYAPLLSHLRATCPAQFILLNLITRKIFGKFKSWSYLIYTLFHSPVTSSALGSNIFFSTLFAENLRLCSSLCVRDQVSHPYKQKAKL
jgi:hypothetical protein